MRSTAGGSLSGLRSTREGGEARLRQFLIFNGVSGRYENYKVKLEVIMQCRIWKFITPSIEPVTNVRLFEHFFPGNSDTSDTPGNRKFLADMCRRHDEKLEWVLDR